MAFEYSINTTNAITDLKLSGRLVDKEQALDIVKDIDTALAEGKSNFVIDLSGLEYMNSTGLNIMINLMNKAREAGGNAVICGMSDRIKSLFVVTKLDSVFAICDTRSEALKKFDKTDQDN